MIDKMPVFAVMPYSREASYTLYVLKSVGYINLGYVNLGKFNWQCGNVMTSVFHFFVLIVETTVSCLIQQEMW